MNVREVIQVPPGTTVTARMATFSEMDHWGLEAPAPVLVVDGRAYPADRYEVKVGGDTEPAPPDAA